MPAAFPRWRTICKLVTWAKTKLKPELTLEIVKRPDELRTFRVLPPPLGRRADSGVDHPEPPDRPRLRTPARTPRDHGPLGGDHHHDQATRRRVSSSGKLGPSVHFGSGFLPKVAVDPAGAGLVTWQSGQVASPYPTSIHGRRASATTGTFGPVLQFTAVGGTPSPRWTRRASSG